MIMKPKKVILGFCFGLVLIFVSVCENFSEKFGALGVSAAYLVENLKKTRRT